MIAEVPAASARLQDTRDQVRTAVQDAVREAVRGAREGAQAAREAAQAATIAPPAPIAPSPDVIAALQAQIAAERSSIDKLTAQLVPGTSDAKEQAIDGQLDASRERLQSLQGQLDRALGGEPLAAFPSVPDVPPFPGDQIPPEAIPIVAIVMSMLAFMVVGWPIARAWGRRLDRKTAAPAPQADIAPRLDRIEQALEAIAIEVERVSEGQRFSTKLMSEMRALPAPNPLNDFQGVQQRVAQPVDRGERGSPGA